VGCESLRARRAGDWGTARSEAARAAGIWHGPMSYQVVGILFCEWVLLGGCDCELVLVLAWVCPEGGGQPADPPAVARGGVRYAGGPRPLPPHTAGLIAGELGSNGCPPVGPSLAPRGHWVRWPVGPDWHCSGGGHPSPPPPPRRLAPGG
jgi:hypothetical protein